MVGGDARMTERTVDVGCTVFQMEVEANINTDTGSACRQALIRYTRSKKA